MIKLRSREFSFKEVTPIECFQSRSNYKSDNIELDVNTSQTNYHRSTKSQSFLGLDRAEAGAYSSLQKHAQLREKSANRKDKENNGMYSANNYDASNKKKAFNFGDEKILDILKIPYESKISHYRSKTPANVNESNYESVHKKRNRRVSSDIETSENKHNTCILDLNQPPSEPSYLTQTNNTYKNTPKNFDTGTNLMARNDNNISNYLDSHLINKNLHNHSSEHAMLKDDSQRYIIDKTNMDFDSHHNSVSELQGKHYKRGNQINKIFEENQLNMNIDSLEREKGFQQNNLIKMKKMMGNQEIDEKKLLDPKNNIVKEREAELSRLDFECNEILAIYEKKIKQEQDIFSIKAKELQESLTNLSY